MSASGKILRGVVHTVLGSYFGKFVNLASTVFLTRILQPEDFGIVAMGLFLATSVGLAKEFGFDFALVHRQTDIEKASSTHFFLNVVTSMAVLFITCVMFFVLRGRYEAAILQTMVALSAIFFLRSLASTSRIMLEKELRFSLLAWIDTTSNMVTLALAVALALLGFGFWSIVIAGSVNSLSYVLFTSVRYWKNHPLYPKKERFDRSMVRWFFSYGKWMLLCSVGLVATLQFDSFIAGTLLGVATLGLYERAYRFSQYPTDAITHVISRVAMSIYAKYQDDNDRLSYYFSFFLSVIVRVAFPLSFVIFIFADDIIAVVFGDRWLPIVPTLRLLVVYSLLRPVLDDTGAFFTAIGRPRIISVIFLIQGSAMVLLASTLTYFYGILGTAAAADIVMFLGVVLVYYKISEYISIPYSRIFIMPAICVVAGYLGYALTFSLLPVARPGIFRLTGVAVFLLFYFVTLISLEREQTARYLKYFRESTI